MNKQDLLNYLDEYLQNWEYKDASKNGLQVDNTKQEIKKIGYAVDASTYIFDRATYEDVDLVLTHHGIFWWHEETLTGVAYKRAQKLLGKDIALYSSHIPLDAHPEVWNNIWLIKAFVRIFGLREEDYEIEEFWNYKWKNIWYGVKFKHQLHISNLVTPYAEQMQLIKKVYNFWNKTYFNSFAVISGSAGKDLLQAKQAWYDVFLTWEANHTQMIMAKEHEQSIMLWWHYETEKIWVKLLAYHLKEKFGLEIVFLDEKY